MTPAPSSPRGPKPAARAGLLQRPAGHLGLYDEASRLRRARIDGMRAELAATLVDGAPCPVCGSLDHPELCELRGDRVTSEQEEAADAALGPGLRTGRDRSRRAGRHRRRPDHRPDRPPRERRVHRPGGPAHPGAEAARLAARAHGLAAEAAQLTAAAARRPSTRPRSTPSTRTSRPPIQLLIELTEQRDAELRQADEAGQRAGRHRQALLAQLDGQPDLATALAAAGEARRGANAAADAADAAARAEQTPPAMPSTGPSRPRPPPVSQAWSRSASAQRTADWRATTDQAIRDHEAKTQAAAELLADPDLDVALDPPADTRAAADAAEAARSESRRGRGRP